MEHKLFIARIFNFAIIIWSFTAQMSLWAADEEEEVGLFDRSPNEDIINGLKDNLPELYLLKITLTNEVAEAFKQCTNLKKITLDEMNEAPSQVYLTLAESLATLPKLTKVAIKNGTLNDGLAACLKRIPCKNLDISNNKINGEQVRSLSSAFKENGNLKVLRFSGNT